MIGDLIEQRFQVRYHNHHVPRLLNDLGFSVQRPRKRLARADAEAQDTWVRERFPAIIKAAACRGVVMFGDEASFWLDGTRIAPGRESACSHASTPSASERPPTSTA